VTRRRPSLDSGRSNLTSKRPRSMPSSGSM
jgi:hypothetical protein